MASSYIPYSGGYVTPDILSKNGLTAIGGSGFVDTQGNWYVNNGSALVQRNDLKPASVPNTGMNSSGLSSTIPVPGASSASGGSASSGQTQPQAAPSSGVSNVSATATLGSNSSTITFTYGGKSYSIPSTSNGTIDQQAQNYLINNGIAPKTAFDTPSVPSQNNMVLSLPNLGPGSTGQDVATLQQWLVANGYMTKADMDTGPGTYGPKTTAAVAAWQKSAGIDTQGNPGYFGPISRTYLSQPGTAWANGVNGAPAGGTTTGSGGSSSTSSTGNPQLDAILASLQGLITTGKAVIPANLQITPELTQQFLSWAHQVVDPQTQQLIQSEIKNINASSQNIATQFNNNQAETIQKFGTDLATEQNAAGGAGVAFSGLRNLTEGNMAASTNRTLSSLASDASYNIGTGLRTAAANVGSTNAGGINTPSLTGATVSQFGGSRGTSSGGNSLDFSYNPSLYTAGVIPSNQNTAVNNLAGNYLGQYGTLAGSNSGRSMSDLFGMMSGLPSGYQVPSTLT